MPADWLSALSLPFGSTFGVFEQPNIANDRNNINTGCSGWPGGNF
jgi:hypothetical protein